MIESGLCSHFRDSNVPRWHLMTSPFQNNHINSALLSQSSCLSQFQYWCLLQNQSNGVIRIDCHLNHVWDKTILHIIPLHLLFLYIHLVFHILLKVIERYYDWKWIVFSFPWFKCTKMIIDDLLFKIMISIQPYWVSLHVSVNSSIDACCKMRVRVSSECIGIKIIHETKQSFTLFISFFFYIFSFFNSYCWKW